MQDLFLVEAAEQFYSKGNPNLIQDADGQVLIALCIKRRCPNDWTVPMEWFALKFDVQHVIPILDISFLMDRLKQGTVIASTASVCWRFEVFAIRKLPLNRA